MKKSLVFWPHDRSRCVIVEAHTRTGASLAAIRVEERMKELIAEHQGNTLGGGVRLEKYWWG